MAISQALILTLINSIWQSALLYFLFILSKPVLTAYRPLLRRNFLMMLLLSQLLTSCINLFTFISDSAAINHVSYFSEALRMSMPLEVLTTWLLSIYLTVLAWKFSLVFRHYMDMRTYLTKGLKKPSADVRLFTSDRAIIFGIERKVSIFISERVSAPMTFGFLKPVILLPVAAATNMDPRSLEMLIIHELTHIKNKDFLLNWIPVLTDSLYFFNPFLSAISRQLKLEREKESDLSVLDFRYPALDYAEALATAASAATIRNSFPLKLTGNKSQLKQRILFFTENRNHQLKHSGIRGLAFFPMLLGLVLSFFSPDLNLNLRNETTGQISRKMVLASMSVQPMENEIAERIEPSSGSGLKKPVKPSKKAFAKVIPSSGAGDSKEAPLPSIREDVDQVYEYAGTELIPAADREPELSKEIILKEEISGGIIRVYCYRAEWKDGEWSFTVKWMAEEKPAEEIKPEPVESSEIRETFE